MGESLNQSGWPNSVPEHRHYVAQKYKTHRSMPPVGALGKRQMQARVWILRNGLSAG